MDLKELLGEELYTQVNEKLEGTKVKLADLSEGAYVDKNKYAALKQQFDEITDKVKGFDGVDVEGLKKQATEWETKYNEDMSKMKLDYALNSSLAGAKNPKAVKALLDMNIIKMDGDNLVGVKEQLEKLKETDAYLFQEAQTTSKGVKIGTPIKNEVEPKTLSEALAQKFNQGE